MLRSRFSNGHGNEIYLNVKKEAIEKEKATSTKRKFVSVHWTNM